MLFQSIPKSLKVEFSTLTRRRNIIRLVNTSRESETLKVQFNKDPNWEVGYEKKSKIAVGLHQELIVDFFPKDFREYHHFVTIRTREGNFEIPFLAIPVDHDTREKKVPIPRFIPPMVDFGRTKLRQIKKRKFWVYFDNVVTEYEFQILVLQQSSQTFFQINPMKGRLIPGQKVEIEITYQPLDYVTSTLDFKLDTNKPFFESQVVRIVGHCVLPSFRKHREKILEIEEQKKQVVVDHDKHVKYYYGISPFTASLLRKKERERKQTEKERGERMELEMKKKKVAMEKKSTEMKLERDRKKYSMKSKHLRLERLYRAFLQREKSKEIKWFSEVGQELVTPDEQDDIKIEREYELQFHGIYRRGKDRAREKNIIGFNPVVDYDFKGEVVNGIVLDWKEPEKAKQVEEEGEWVDIRRLTEDKPKDHQTESKASSSASSSRRSSKKPTPRKKKGKLSTRSSSKKPRRRGSKKPEEEELEGEEEVKVLTEEEKKAIEEAKRLEEEKVVFEREARKMRKRLMEDFRQISEYAMLQTRVEERLRKLEESSLEVSSVVRLRKSGIPPLQYRKMRIKEIGFRNPTSVSGSHVKATPQVPTFRDFDLMPLKAPCYYRIRNYKKVESFSPIMTYMEPKKPEITFKKVEEEKTRIDEEKRKIQEEKDQKEREKQEKMRKKKEKRKSGRGSGGKKKKKKK